MKVNKFFKAISRINEKMTLQQRITCLTTGVVIVLGLILILFINLIAPIFVIQEVGIPDTYVLTNTINAQGTSVALPMDIPGPEGYTIFKETGLKSSEPLAVVKILSIIGFVIIAVLAILSSKWVARKTLEPVQKISTIAQQVSARNLDKRLNYQGAPDEVKMLADAFDLMLQRLQLNFKDQGEFVSNLAHELRTPLTSLRMNLEVLNSDPEATLKDYQDFSEIAERSLSRLERLVEDLLLLAKAEKEIDYFRIVVGVMFEDILEELAPIAEKKRISLKLGGDPELEVKGDPLLLNRALVNLVENGIHYNRPGGFVEISARKVESQVVIDVHDNGTGISESQQSHIFERFFRGESRNANYGGKGLGLAITAHIIALLNGQIEVKSELGKGSIFRIYLKTA